MILEKRSKDVNVMKVNLKELYEYCKSQGYNYSEAQFCQDLKEIAVEELNDNHLCRVTGGAKMNKKFYAGVCAALSLTGSASLSNVKGVHFTSNYSELPDFSKIYAVSTKKNSSKHSLKKILAAAVGGGLITLAVGGPIIAYAAKSEGKPSNPDSQQLNNWEDLSLDDIKPYATKIFEDYCRILCNLITNKYIESYSIATDIKVSFIKNMRDTYSEVSINAEEKEMLMGFICANPSWRSFIAFVDSITQNYYNGTMLMKELNEQINKCVVLRPIHGLEFTTGTSSKIDGKFVSPGAASLQARFNRAKDRLMRSGNEWSPEDILSLMFDKKPGELPTIAEIMVYMPGVLTNINPWEFLIEVVKSAKPTSLS